MKGWWDGLMRTLRIRDPRPSAPDAEDELRRLEEARRRVAILDLRADNLTRSKHVR
jgi:hypothetical protein